MRVYYFRCCWPSNLVVVVFVRCVTYMSNLSKIGQKVRSLLRTICIWETVETAFMAAFSKSVSDNSTCAEYKAYTVALISIVRQKRNSLWFRKQLLRLSITIAAALTQ